MIIDQVTGRFCDISLLQIMCPLSSLLSRCQGILLWGLANFTVVIVYYVSHGLVEATAVCRKPRPLVKLA